MMLKPQAQEWRLLYEATKPAHSSYRDSLKSIERTSPVGHSVAEMQERSVMSETAIGSLNFHTVEALFTSPQ